MTIAIFGAGSLGKEILSLIRIGTINNWDEIIFIDDVIKEESVSGIKKYTYKEFQTCYSNKQSEIVIASGEPQARRKIYDKVKADRYCLAKVISKDAYVGLNSSIGEGTVVFPHVYVSNDVIIENNCIIHSNSIIESECKVGESSFISLGAFVGANTLVGNNVFVGPNASVFDHTTLHNNSIIGMGSVVTENVEEGIVVVGNPAKMKRKNTTGRVFRKEHCNINE